MANKEIKIFYSWQSDLPGNITRNFIAKSIESAVKELKDTVCIEVDRDTKGEFGSPDITETIFSKIDECDIFIADVSIVNNYNVIDADGGEKIKRYTPNPNVMLELGYASKVVGWENIICIINTDYGAIEDLPFDIKHRRLTPYSLNNNENSKMRKKISDIISATVTNLIECGIRVKDNGFSNISVGSYDSQLKKITDRIVPWNPKISPAYLSELEILWDEIKELIKKIESIYLAEDLNNLMEKADENNEFPFYDLNKLKKLK